MLRILKASGEEKCAFIPKLADSGPFTTESTLLIPDAGTCSVMKEGEWLLKGFKYR